MRFGLHFVVVAVVLSIFSVPTLADRIATDGGSMNDGSAGNWYDADANFFGFGSNLTGPFWGANLLFTDGATLIDGTTPTSTALTVTGIEIMFNASGMTPIVSNSPNTGGATVFTACNLMGPTPQFGPGVSTSITCQFADPNFVSNFEALPNSGTEWFAVFQLGGTGGLGHASTAAGSVHLTFLTSAPGAPEPATIGMSLLGLGTMIAVYRRRQKKGQA